MTRSGAITALVTAAAWGSLATAPAVQPNDAIPSAQLDSARGATLFAEKCSACHDHPTGRIPPVFVLNYKSPEEIVNALTRGPMQPMAAGLSADDIRQLAIHLSHREPGSTPEPDAKANLCRKPGGPVQFTKTSWNGLGADAQNTRYQLNPGISLAGVPRLAVKWAFAYPGGTAYGQPVVVGDRLFVTSSVGRIYSLDAKSGCTWWTAEIGIGVRTAVSVGPLPASAGPKAAVYFGDEKGAVHALDAETGKQLWTTQVDDHPVARITGSPTLFGDTLVVPVSAMDEGAEWDRAYPCCTFRGSVVAVDAVTGHVRWKTYMIPRPAAPLGRTNEAGTPLSGPAGAAIWGAPSVDPQRKRVYVATGNAYNDAEEGDTNAVVALDLATGERRWAVQPMPSDDPFTACKASRTDCEKPIPERMEFGDAPVLRHLADGRDMIVVGQKSGVVYGLDPDNGGKIVWQARIGEGGPLGGVMYGAAVDMEKAYLSVADRDAKPPFAPGGLTALSLADGRKTWHAPSPGPSCSWGASDCSGAQPGAVTAIPGAVFSGSLDGHIRGYSTRDGAILWDFDTAQSFEAINGVKAKGGSVNGYPAIVADGMLYVNSGGSLLTHPGNVLLAFTADGK
jgi:polyvinyl alcohol dehydrogenase (cytochrome)